MIESQAGPLPAGHQDHAHLAACQCRQPALAGRGNALGRAIGQADRRRSRSPAGDGGPRLAGLRAAGHALEQFEVDFIDLSGQPLAPGSSSWLQKASRCSWPSGLSRFSSWSFIKAFLSKEEK